MITVAVVIPFYQRVAGILSHALASVAAQDLPDGVAVEIIVVDDASPVSPGRDCQGLQLPDHVSIRILPRPNGGPGAARNTGLEAIRPHVAFVAFLDSDDTWNPRHLRTAIAALGGVSDVYFCDHWRPDRPKPHFAEVLAEFGVKTQGRADTQLLLAATQADAADQCHVFELDAALPAMLEAYLAHTSTLVFRRSRFEALRFDEALRSAGEDYLFVMRLASHARSVCYSTSVLVTRGTGVSLYDSASSWDGPDALRLVLDNLRCALRAWRQIRPEGLAAERLRRMIRTRRLVVVYVWFRRLVLARHADFPILAEAVREDPGLLLHLPAILSRVFARKALRLLVVEKS